MVYILLCVLAQKDVNLFQSPAGTLTFSAQTTKLQALGDEDLMWRKIGGTETAWDSYRESQQVSFPLPFQVDSEDPTVTPSWSPDCRSQRPPNAPSCQQACQIWEKELSLRKCCIQTENFLQLLFTVSSTRALSTPFEESGTCRHDGGSRRHRVQGANTSKGQVQHLTNSTVLWESQGKGMMPLLWPDVSTDKWHLSNWTQIVHFLALNVWLEKATLSN